MSPSFCSSRASVDAMPDAKILPDPKYLIPWELWYYSMLRSCQIFRINNTTQQPTRYIPLRESLQGLCADHLGLL